MGQWLLASKRSYMHARLISAREIINLILQANRERNQGIYTHIDVQVHINNEKQGCVSCICLYKAGQGSYTYSAKYHVYVQRLRTRRTRRARQMEIHMHGEASQNMTPSTPRLLAEMQSKEGNPHISRRKIHMQAMRKSTVWGSPRTRRSRGCYLVVQD